MNRAERRKNKKKNDWIKQLGHDKQLVIAEMIQRAADEKAKREVTLAVERMMEQVETCVAASITKNLDNNITFDEILKVLKDFNEFLYENADFVDRFREGWKKKLDNIEPKIIGRMEELLKAGVTKKEIVLAMRKEFKDITNAHVYNAYKAAQDKIRNDIEELVETEQVKVEEPVEVVEVAEIKEMKEVTGDKEMSIVNQLEKELDITVKAGKKIEQDLKILQEKLKEANKKKNALSTAINALKDVM